MIACGHEPSGSEAYLKKTNRALERLKAGWADNRLICVGLDPDAKRMPKELQAGAPEQAVPYIWEHCMRSVQASHGRALAYKPNLAFFEGWGHAGIIQLKMLIEYLRGREKDVPIILDFKRGDIGATNAGYVREAVEYFQVDGVTLHPYLGMDATAPFLELSDMLLFFLCKTSNPGSGEFQNRHVALEPQEAVDLGLMEGATVPLYHLVAHRIASHWNKNGNCGLVVGATYPQELAQVRLLAGDAPILAPGVGTQGGDLEATVRGGIIAGKGAQGLLINIGSGIMYAENPPMAFATYDRAAQAALTASIPR